MAIQFVRHCCFAYFKIQQKNMATQILNHHKESYFESVYFGILLLISS